MIAIILDLLYLIVLLLISPLLLYRIIAKGKYWKTFGQRLGLVKLNECSIWIHGVSVGEIKAAKPLVEELGKKFPNHTIVISSTSSRGLEVATNLYEQYQVFSFPIDFSWSIKQYLKQLNPKLIILMELELWPNFLLATEKNQIPVLLVNGRISERSFKRYKLIKFFFVQMTKGISLFSVQSSIYRDRLCSLGIKDKRIITTGNIKFDAVKQITFDPSISEELAIQDTYTVLIAGSTHWPEEKILLSCYSQWVKEFPELRLIIVPRHPERVDEIKKCAHSFDLKSCKRSEKMKQWTHDIIAIGDKMGELASIYALGQFAIIGGSFIPHGGQNFIEPASLGKTVICGPFMHNFPDIRLFLEEDAALQVSSEQDLLVTLKNLFQDRERAHTLGRKAANLVKQNQGSVQKNFELCAKLLSREQ